MNPETKTSPKSQNHLTGHYFHSVNQQGVIEWQGQVVGHPEPEWYLIQLYEWLCGEPSVQRLMRIDEMQCWLFYESAEDMIYSYEHGTARQGGKYRP